MLVETSVSSASRHRQTYGKPQPALRWAASTGGLLVSRILESVTIAKGRQGERPSTAETQAQAVGSKECVPIALMLRVKQTGEVLD